MARFILIGLLLVNGTVTAQIIKESMLLGDTLVLHITVEKLANEMKKISFTKAANFKDSTHQFEIKTDDRKTFITAFRYAIKESNYFTGETSFTAREQDIVKLGTELFDLILTNLNVDNTLPQAGLLQLHEQVPIYREILYKDSIGKKKIQRNTIKSSWPDSILRKLTRLNDATPIQSSVRGAEVEVGNGFIQNMIIYIDVKNKNGEVLKTHPFVLPFPVGISAVENIRNFKNIQLYAIDGHYGLAAKYKKAQTVDGDKVVQGLPSADSSYHRVDSSYYIMLDDAISYFHNLGLERRDYSPQDTLVLLESGQRAILYKDRTSKLFETHIYSDISGLKESRPNGLVQVEIQKRINVNTKQHHWYRNNLGNLFKSYGFCNYIMPSVAVTKIENHNKYLLLKDLSAASGLIDSSQFEKGLTKYAGSLDLFRYKWFSGGFDLNLIYLYNHESKFELTLNGGVRLNLTETADSLLTDSLGNELNFGNRTIPTLQYFPELRLRFLPVEQFNFAISSRLLFSRTLSNEIYAVSSHNTTQDNILLRKTPIFNASELLMTINLNRKEHNKIFGRLIFNCDIRNPTDNFTQIQVGYSSLLFARKNP